MRGGVLKISKALSAARLIAGLILIALFISWSAPRAFAQASPAMELYHSESGQSIARRVTAALSKRSVSQAGGYGTETALGQILDLPPLPGEQAFTDSAKMDDAKKYMDEGKIPDFGKNNRSSVNMVLPPLKGFQQLNDSDVLKNMFKEMVTAKVPVLFQTYMMVENGAATGYMGGLNAVSNIMSNTMQTQDYQLKLLELTDDTGKMKEAYIQRVREAFEKENAKTWPAALYAAAGDSGDFKAGSNQGMDALPQPRAFDLKGLPMDGSTNIQEPETRRLLSDLLFIQKEDPQANNNALGGGGDSSAYSNEDLDTLKREFVRLIGDVQIELKGGQGQKASESWLRTLNMNFIAPEKSEERRGVARENWTEVGVTWEGINLILHRYCEFVKEDPNRARKIESGEVKVTASTYEKIINNPDDANPASNPWVYVSSPDIPITMSLVEALFHLVRQTNDAQALQCEDLRLDRDHIPTERFNGKAGDQNSDLNDCGQNKGCLRNRLILHMSFIIARSRTLHTYRTMYLLSKRFATDPALSELVDELFMRSLAGMNIDEELGKNREAWARFTSFLTKIVQGDSFAGGFYKGGLFVGGTAGSPSQGGPIS